MIRYDPLIKSQLLRQLSYAPLAAVLAAFASLAYADGKYPIGAVPDLMTSCRAGDPMQCFVPVAEEWQAKYRERCAEAPQRCTYRPDGTILSWTSEYKPSPQLVQALHDVRQKYYAEQARARAQGGSAP